MITVNVKLFGALRNYASSGALEISLPSGSTVKALREVLEKELRHAHPGFHDEGILSASVIASERSILREHEVIEASGSYAVLPPVCGG